MESIQSHLHESFAGTSSRPRLEVGYSYGYPAFKVTFATQSEHEMAVLSGKTREFNRRVEIVCSTSGSNERPFNAEQAVFLPMKATSRSRFVTGRARSDA